MIYICIPSHNEERTIGILLWKIRQVLTAFPRDYQLLVLDDASDDRTPEVLAPYARILPLTVLRHEQRKGYAASLDELIREAVRRSEYPRRDVVLTLQADFTEEPDEIPALLKRIESGADIVTTRVRIAPEHAPRKVRWMRAGMTRLLRRLDWPENVTDMLSGLRAYRVIGLRKALEARGAARLVEWHDAWAANAALLRAVQPHVRRVDEVEAQLRPDRLQRASRFDPWTTARQLARLAFGRDSATPVPARQGGAIVVSAEDLAAAARDLRPAATTPARRGQGGARARPGAAAGSSRRGSRSDTETGQTPARGRRGKGERAQAPEPTGRPERPERPEQPERAPRRSRARTPRPESAADTVDAALETGMPAAPPPKSRRHRRGAAGTADAADTTALSLEGIIADVPQGAASAPAGTAPPEGASSVEIAGPDGAASVEGASAEGAPPVERVTLELADAQTVGDGAGADAGAGGIGEDAAGAGEKAASGRKRRRRSSRRGRGRRERAGTSEGVEGGPVSSEEAPLELAQEQGPVAAGGRPRREPGALEGDSGGRGEGAAPEAPQSGGAVEEGAGGGAEAGAEASADGTPASGRPRRRSRRGGRGRSRRRTGAGTGAAEVEAQPGEASTSDGPAARESADPAPGAIRPLALLPPGRPEPPREAPPQPGPAWPDAGAGPD